MSWEVRQGDCVEEMQKMDEASVDAVVCDPPYGLEFMGKEWDRFAPQDTTAKVLRKTGGKLRGDQSTPHGRTGVSGKSSPRASYRCERCGGWTGVFSEARKKRQRPCECDAPQIDYGRLGATPAMRAFQNFSEAWATEALRVLKPGGHLLAFGGTRTSHRLACAIEDAGFEIRDSLIWLYGSGFPKSLDVSKAIDKAAGAEREVVGVKHAEKYPNGPGGVGFHGGPGEYSQVGRPPEPETAPATPEAQRWQGWGTALKPGHEPVVVARKPLIGTVSQNVLEHGTGALNVDACRIGDNPGWSYPNGAGGNTFHGQERRTDPEASKGGRWPANCVLSHLPECEVVGERKVKPKNGSGKATRGHVGASESSSLFGFGGGDERPRGYVDPDGTETVTAYSCASGCPVAELDAQSGESTSRQGEPRLGQNGDGWGMTATGAEYADRGGASRFFYCAKASRSERNAGLEGLPDDMREGQSAWGRTCNVCGDSFVNPATGKPKCGHDDFDWTTTKPTKNAHPTVKPINLMRWLCRLVTPPEGLILDPFVGSGTTGIAAILEGFDVIGIERESEYVEIARARIQHWANQPVQLGLEAA